MKKEYEMLLTRINNQIKEMEEKLEKLKKEYQEKCEEYNDVNNEKNFIEQELENINVEMEKLMKNELAKESKKYRVFSKMMYGTGIALSLGMTEASIITGSSDLIGPILLSIVSTGVIGGCSQIIGEFKQDGNSKKLNRKISENKKMIELNKKKNYKEGQLSEVTEKVNKIKKEKESTYLTQSSCEKDLNLIELFKLELIYQVNSGNTNSIEVSKEKKPYEKPMMRIRKKED